MTYAVPPSVAPLMIVADEPSATLTGDPPLAPPAGTLRGINSDLGPRAGSESLVADMAWLQTEVTRIMGRSGFAWTAMTETAFEQLEGAMPPGESAAAPAAGPVARYDKLGEIATRLLGSDMEKMVITQPATAMWLFIWANRGEAGSMFMLFRQNALCAAEGLFDDAGNQIGSRVICLTTLRTAGVKKLAKERFNLVTKILMSVGVISAPLDDYELIVPERPIAIVDDTPATRQETEWLALCNLLNRLIEFFSANLDPPRASRVLLAATHNILADWPRPITPALLRQLANRR